MSSLLSAIPDREPFLSRSTNPARKALVEQLYRSIMGTLLASTGSGSDRLTETYLTTCSTKEQTRAASSLLMNFRGGVSAFLDQWIDNWNTAYAADMGCEPHDHASATCIEIEPPGFSSGYSWPIVRVGFTLAGGSGVEGGCAVCSNLPKARDNTRTVLPVSVVLTRENNGWVISDYVGA